MAHLEISIPATTEVVDRGPGLAAYLKGREPLAGDNFALTRDGDGVVTIDVDEAHGLSVGDQIFIDGVLPTGEVGDTDSGTPSGNFSGADDSKSGTTNAAIHSTNSQAGTYEGVYAKAVRDTQKRLIVLGGATTPDGSTFTAKNNVTALEVVSEAVSPSGGREITYKWTQVSSDGTHGFVGNHFRYRNFAASLLEDGRILCTGGAIGDDFFGVSGNGWDLIQFLSPDSVSQQNGTLPAARASHAQCSLIGSPDAIVSGGWVGLSHDPVASAIRFQTDSQTWTTLTSMKNERMHHALVALDESTILAIGGRDTTGKSVYRCELYDIGGDTWTFTGNMTYRRHDFGVVKIPDGRVIVIGGRGQKATLPWSSAVLATCEIYDPNTGLWSMLPPMRAGREIFATAYNPEEHCIYVTGGANGTFGVEVLDVSTMKWRMSQAQIQTTHLICTGGLVGDDIFAMIGGSDHGIDTEKKNQIVVPGDDRTWLGAGINGMHTVATVPDGTHLTVETEEYDYSGGYTTSRAGASVTPMGAEAGPSTIPGPFSYDTKTGVAITAVAGTTNQEFNEGGNYASLLLDDNLDPEPALQFPDEEGYLVLQFGYKDVVGPIRYFGRLSDTELILDAGSVWQSSLPVGATVRLLSSRLPFSPESDARVGNFYATGTAAGRVAAQNTINDIVAAGKQILVTVIYPGDRGLGGAGFPQSGNYKLSDKVGVWGGDDLDQEIPAARKGQS